MVEMLPDSGHIQEQEAAQANRRADKGLASKDNGRQKAAQPLYTREDAEAAVRHLRGLEYNQVYELSEGIKVKLTDAGHILGAAMVWLEFGKGARKKTVLYTGNFGHDNSPILLDVQGVDAADVVITESTYGNRRHERCKRPDDFGDELLAALDRARVKATGGCGRIVIPCFSVDRTQVILYELRQLMKEGKIPITPVYLDSPMAIRVTGVYRRYARLLRPHIAQQLADGVDLFAPPKFIECLEWEQSKQLDASFNEPIIVLAGSGMAEGGRIVRHLEQQLPRAQSSVFMVGFQAPGTLGERLLNQATGKVRIAGKEVPVKAPVTMLPYYSGHADRRDIKCFLERLPRRPQTIYAVHGEPEACSELAKYIDENLHYEMVIPKARDTFIL